VCVGLSGEARVLLRRLAESGVQILTRMRVTEVSASGHSPQGVRFKCRRSAPGRRRGSARRR
jgi:hypothetical protein